MPGRKTELHGAAFRLSTDGSIFRKPPNKHRLFSGEARRSSNSSNHINVLSTLGIDFLPGGEGIGSELAIRSD